MLSNDSPEQLAPSDKDLEARFRGRSTSSQVHGKGVAASMAVEANSVGNRDRKVCKLPFSRRSNLTAIQPGRKDKSSDNLELRCPRPWHALKVVAHPSGLDNPAIEGRATKLAAHVELPTQISRRSDARDLGLDVGPVMVAQHLSSPLVGTVSVTLLSSNFRSNAMQVRESTRVALLESDEVSRALS